MDINHSNETTVYAMKKELEQKNKLIWTSMWVIIAVSFVAYFAIITFAVLLIPESILQTIIIFISTVLFLIPCFYALKLEVSVGAYKCKKCECEIIPTYSEALIAIHNGTTRYLKCPQCNKRTWCKKILNSKK